MKFHILKTEEDYEEALSMIDGLLRCEPYSKEEDDLELLSILVEAYEKKHYGAEFECEDDEDPVDAICSAVDSMGLSKNDLVPYIGSKAKVNEILERKRNLTLPMIKKLHKNLHIPA